MKSTFITQFFKYSKCNNLFNKNIDDRTVTLASNDWRGKWESKGKDLQKETSDTSATTQ